MRFGLFILSIAHETYLYTPKGTNTTDWLGIVILIAFFGIPLLLGLIASWHYKKKAELDRKLMSVLREEFPDYNYNILKSEMHYVYAKHYRCPRCGGILERKDDLPKPIKCTKAGCNYPGK